MELFSTGVPSIGGSALISLLGMWVVRKFAPYEVMEGHKEMAGFIYGILGTIYAVILAFSIVVLREEIRGAEAIADREASQLSDLHRLVQGLPAGQTHAFHRVIEKVLRVGGR